MAVNAVLTTGNINTNTMVRDVSRSLAFVAPGYAQLLFLAAGFAPDLKAPYQIGNGAKEQGAMPIKMNIRNVTNFKYEWHEDALKSTTTKINNGAGYTTSSTSLVVDDASIFAVNDLVDVVSTGEILAVTAVNTGTNTLTVTRSWGATAAAAIADNDDLLIIGNAFSENSPYALAPHRLPTDAYNYIQDTRHSFASTFALGAHDLYTGDERRRTQAKKLVEHQQSIEASLLYGEKNDGVGADGSPKKSVGGFLERLNGSTNVTAVGGTLTKSTFNTWLKGIFSLTATGNRERIVVASPTVANAISNFAADDSSAPKSQMWVLNNASKFGLNIMSYTTKFGTIHLMMHGMLTGAVYNGYAFALEPGTFRLCRSRGNFFMNLREDIVKDGTHRYVDEYASYFGLEFQNPDTGGLLTGVTG